MFLSAAKFQVSVAPQSDRKDLRKWTTCLYRGEWLKCVKLNNTLPVAHFSHLLKSFFSTATIYSVYSHTHFLNHEKMNASETPLTSILGTAHITSSPWYNCLDSEPISRRRKVKSIRRLRPTG